MRIIFLSFLLLLLASCSPVNKTQVNKETATLAPVQSQRFETPSPLSTSTEIKSTKQSISTITVTATTAITPTAISQVDQSNSAIPTCINSENPTAIEDFHDLKGVIIYQEHDISQWFALTGDPPEIKQVDIYQEEADNLSFSRNGEWLLLYSQKPKAIRKSEQYPVWLISRDGQKREIIIDLSKLTAVEHEDNSITSNFLSWSLSWVNENIVRVRAAYGEESTTVLPDYLYSYFDITKNVWLEEPLKAISNRKNSMWADISPDLTRVLFLNHNSEIVLRDITGKTDLWKKQAGSSQLPPFATWSPNNQTVAFWSDGYPDEVQLLSRDGKNSSFIKKPIYASDTQKFIPYRGFFEWAPDSKRIAITGRIQDSQNGTVISMLYVYDTEKEQYVYQCPMGDNSKKTVSSNVLWSPDGKFIIPEVFQSKTTPFNLYDIDNKRVYQILPPGNAGVVWLREIPSYLK